MKNKNTIVWWARFYDSQGDLIWAERPVNPMTKTQTRVWARVMKKNYNDTRHPQSDKCVAWESGHKLLSPKALRRGRRAGACNLLRCSDLHKQIIKESSCNFSNLCYIKDMENIPTYGKFGFAAVQARYQKALEAVQAKRNQRRINREEKITDAEIDEEMERILQKEG